MLAKGLPYFISGTVVRGYGRGSKQLGIPTANYPEEVVIKLPPEIEPGVYCGWAQISSGPVDKMVMSIGWNPYYKNIKKSMEVHILKQFEHDFYGSTLRVCILEYIRPEMDFCSVDELIGAIKADIEGANHKLEIPYLLKYKEHDYFQIFQ